MRDRQPTQPGRVLLTPENGDAPFYAIMEMADEPTDIGTPPTKVNLLKDTTAALLGGGADMVPDEALVILANAVKNNERSIASILSEGCKIETGSYVGNGGATNTRTFSFNPNLLIVVNGTSGIGTGSSGYTDNTGALFLRTQIGSAINSNLATLTWSEKTFSLTHASKEARYAYNESNITYNYIAMG